MGRGVPPENEKNTLLYGKDIDKKYTLIYGNIRKSDPCLRIYIRPAYLGLYTHVTITIENSAN